MIRTVWLALACLAVLGTLAVGKASFPPPPDAPASAQGSANEATIGRKDFTQDTLAKGDRLQITYVHQEIPAGPASQSTEAFIPPVSTIVPPVERKIISRHWHDPYAVAGSGAKSKQSKRTVTTEKGKSADSKGSQASDQSKPAEQVKPCSRTGALGDVLRSLSLSPPCDS
jgi:hypothetical protein